MAENYMSRQGYKDLEKKIQGLIKEKGQVALDVEEARQQGDLKENAGYHAAKDRLAEILRLIHEIKEKLQTAKFTAVNNIAVRIYNQKRLTRNCPFTCKSVSEILFINIYCIYFPIDGPSSSWRAYAVSSRTDRSG